MRWGWLWMVGLAGCEQMSEPGGFSAMFSPVTIEAPQPPVGTPPAPDATPTPTPVPDTSTTPTPKPVDPYFPPEPPEPPVVDAAPGTPPDGAGAEPGGEPTAEGGAAALTPPPAPLSSEPAPPPPPPASTASVDPMGAMSGGGWPLRLIKTLPDTQPPRAILGLPSGEEIVVSPGKMLPEQGLVVMSIGPRSAELVLIAPAGDHAAVRTISLNTQY